MPPLRARNFINGEWRDAAQDFESLNPADRRDVIGIAPLSGKREVDDAVSAAKHAFKSWRELSWVNRAELIDNFAQLLRRDTDELGALITRECGKPFNEGRADAVEAMHMAQYVAGLGRQPIGYAISS